jgi:Tfp pilus assembly protein PilN
MRAVNLLPSNLAEEGRRPKTPVLVACGGAVVATAVLATGYLSASSSIGKQNAAIAKVQAEISALPRPVPPPATISGLPAERQARLAAVESALSQRVAWDRILREISLVLPDDVWLQSLDATAPTAGASSSTGQTAPTGFTLNGFTYSQSGVARLLSRLAVVPDLENVALQSATQSQPDQASGKTGPAVVNFVISGNLRAPGATS